VDTEPTFARIVTVLSPYLGATMAEASIRAHGQKLGIEGPTLSASQLEALLAKLRGGLAVFVGREKTAAIVEKIRESLGTAAGDGA
jgi:hypothetical protein